MTGQSGLVIAVSLVRSLWGCAPVVKGTDGSAGKGRDRGRQGVRAAPRWMAVSAAAILAVYTAGYVRTEAAATSAATLLTPPSGQGGGAGQAQISAAPAAPSATTAAAAAGSAQAQDASAPRGSAASGASRSGSPAAPSATTGAAADGSGAGTSTTNTRPASSDANRASSAPASAPPAAAQSKYRDGTYSAVGWGRHGSVQTTIVVTSGRIVSANVTDCGTTYTCAYLDPLVADVVAVQGPSLHYVSGATDSSLAYGQATTQALAQARAQ